jgi:hypothetical protein
LSIFAWTAKAVTQVIPLLRGLVQSHKPTSTNTLIKASHDEWEAITLEEINRYLDMKKCVLDVKVPVKTVPVFATFCLFSHS